MTPPKATAAIRILLAIVLLCGTATVAHATTYYDYNGLTPANSYSATECAGGTFNITGNWSLDAVQAVAGTSLSQAYIYNGTSTNGQAGNCPAGYFATTGAPDAGKKLTLTAPVTLREGNYTVLFAITGNAYYGAAGNWPRTGNTTFIRYLNRKTGAGGTDGLSNTLLGVYFSDIAPPPTLTLGAANLVNGSAIVGICLSATGTNTTQNLCNSTGTSITFNTTGIYNITLHNISGGTYFNVTVQNYNFSSTSTLTVNTSQALLSVSAKQLYSNSTIYSFNITNGIAFNTTTAGYLLVPANNGSNNLLVQVNGNYTANASCTVAQPLITSYCTISGIYDGIYTLGVKYGSTVVSNFSVTTTNATLGGAISNLSTTNGTIYVPVVQGYHYNFYVSPQNYTFANVTLAANSSVQYYNFSVYQAQTLNISFYDEMTRSLLNNKNLTFELISDLQAGNYSTSNGTIIFSLLVPSNYTLRYGGVEYPERDYFQTISAQTYNSVKLYLINFSESGNVLVTVQDTGGEPIEGAVVKLMRYYSYCNCYEVVEMSETSSSGQAYFNAQYYEGHYKWSVDYEGSNYFLSSSPEKLVPGDGQTIVTRSFTVNLGSNYYESYTAITNVGALCGFNEQTEALTFTWSDNSGLVSRGCLSAEHVVGVHYESDGASCVESGTGSIVLPLNNTNSTRYKYTASVTIDGHDYALSDCSGYLDPAPNNNFGGKFGVFLAGGILVTLILIFSYSAIAVLIISAVGVIFVSALGVMTFSTAFITGLAALVFGLAVYFMRS